MWATKSKAKNLRNMKRLITFLQSEIISPTTLSLKNCPQSTISLSSNPSLVLTKTKVDLISIRPKKPCLSLVRLHCTDIPPTQPTPGHFPHSLKDVSLRSQPPPRSSKLPTQQTYCTSCHKIFETKDDEKYHQETQYGREDCYLLRSMLPFSN